MTDSPAQEKGAHLIDWVPAIEGSPGIVVDKDLAARTPCTVYKIDETEMAFSSGIIGTLSKPQIKAYCPSKVYKTEGLVRRVKRFKEAAAECKVEIKKYPKGKRMEPWLTCMGGALRKRGIEI